jgi:spore coat polysaccharide biosynthesis protein SpsF
MTILVIVQARMSSSRLPGKVLEPVAGAPMIVQQLARVARARLIDDIVVATSTDPGDDRLVQTVQQAGYRVHRGSLQDVLGRFLEVLDTDQPDVIVRITADCPLISPTVIDSVIAAFTDTGVDYASNTLTPTYPDGLDVEVVRATALRQLARQTLDADEHEHVTLGIYRRPEEFTLHAVTSSPDNSNLRWTVDTPEDLAFVRWVFDRLHSTDFDYADVLALLAQHPDRTRTAADGLRNAALAGKDTGTMRSVTP